MQICLTPNDQYEEEEDVVNWQLKAANVLFNHGHKSLLSALSTSMTSCIPSLAKASLITVSWMSRYLFVIKDEKLCLMAPSILVLPLIKYLNRDKDVEDQVLASYSLLNLSKYTGESCFTLYIFSQNIKSNKSSLFF